MQRLYIILLCILLVMPLARAQSSLHISKKEFRTQFLDAINQKRATGCTCGIVKMKPAPPLIWNNQLADAAQAHAKDMYKNEYFSHQSRDGGTMQTRILKAGYQYKGFQSYAIGENIAFGQQTIDEVLTGWFKSSEHCKNLMNPAFNEIGIAENNFYWVQDFGGRVKFGLR